MSQRFRIRRRRLIAVVTIGFALAASAEAQPLEVKEKLAAVAVEGGAVAFRVSTNDAVTLKVGGESYRSTQRFAAGEMPHFAPVDQKGFALPDGVYKWELVTNPRLSSMSEPANPSAKPEHGRATHAVAAPEGRRQAGSFAIANGRVVDSTLIEVVAPVAEASQLPEASKSLSTYHFDDSDGAAADGERNRDSKENQHENR